MVWIAGFVAPNLRERAPFYKASFCRLVVAVVQHPPGSALDIIILPIFQRPQEGRQRQRAHAKGNRDENEESVHDAIDVLLATAREGTSAVTGGDCLRNWRNRMELSTTIIEDVDMAMAATSGVAWPRMATGTAMML